MQITAKRIEDIQILAQIADFVPEVYSQIEQNQKTVTKRLQIGEIQSGAIDIACYGPSLKSTWLVDRPARSVATMTCSGSHDYLRSIGDSPPLYHIECDWREHKAEFVKNPWFCTNYLIASCVHPKLLQYLNGYDVTLWNSDMTPYYYYPANELTFRSLGSVGLQAIIVAHALGYREMHIYGMDCSFKLNGKRHSGPHNGPAREPDMYVVVENQLFRTSMVFVMYAKMFVEVVKNMPDTKFILAGDGMLQEYMKVLQKNVSGTGQ